MPPRTRNTDQFKASRLPVCAKTSWNWATTCHHVVGIFLLKLAIYVGDRTGRLRGRSCTTNLLCRGFYHYVLPASVWGCCSTPSVGRLTVKLLAAYLSPALSLGQVRPVWAPQRKICRHDGAISVRCTWTGSPGRPQQNCVPKATRSFSSADRTSPPWFLTDVATAPIFSTFWWLNASTALASDCLPHTHLGWLALLSRPSFKGTRWFVISGFLGRQDTEKYCSARNWQTVIGGFPPGLG